MPLERPPIYINGKTKIQSAFTKGSQIAILIRLMQASGKVVIGFVINTTVKTRDYNIINGIHEACDAEGLRIMKQLPYNWFPTILNGKLVEIEHTITIAFKNNF